MKKVLVVFLAVCGIGNLSSQSQTAVSISYIWPDSLRVRQINVNSIWVDGNGDILVATADINLGGMMHSADEGRTWQNVFKPINFDSRFAFAVMRDKKTNAILLGTAGGVFRSTDEGANWTMVWQAGARCFLTRRDGSILAGTSYQIGLSEDDGKTWRDIFYDGTPYFNVEALTVNPKTGAIFAATADTIGLGVLRSTDDGKTWQKANNGLGDLHTWSVASDENGVIYAGTQKSGLYVSKNNGDSWARVLLDTAQKHVAEILVVRPDLIFVGFEWDGLRTQKSGVLKYNGTSWTKIVPDSVLSVMSLAMNDNVLFMGTYNGLYRVDGVITGVENVHSEVPSEFRLEQNYPNPFNPSTTIEFSVPKRSSVGITIWNAIGQKIETLVDGELSAGLHRVTWDAAKFPSGVYLYRLEAKNFIQTKKMLLVK